MTSTTYSERALVARINRKLAHDDRRLHRNRMDASGNWRYGWGEFYIRDYNRNFVLDTDVDIENLGRELGVL